MISKSDKLPIFAAISWDDQSNVARVLEMLVNDLFLRSYWSNSVNALIYWSISVKAKMTHECVCALSGSQNLVTEQNTLSMGTNEVLYWVKYRQWGGGLE